MKKVLVTGASGAIGLNVIKYLLSEGKYEITALDLRTKNSSKKLKKYRRRINIIYGDINDSVLIDALINNQDYIIHLAGILPPFADIKANLSENIEYTGTENLIKAIGYYNPECHLLYASSSSIYGKKETVSVKSKTDILDIDYYSKTKLKCENLIKKKIKNYTIFRIPLVLCNPKTNSFMYNVPRNMVVEPITDNDVAYMFVNALNKDQEINKQIFNVSGGEEMRAKYREILARVLEIYGFSFKYFFTMLFIDKNYYCHKYEDADISNEILEYRSDSLSSYYMRLKRQVKGRRISRFFAKPFVFILRGKKK